MRIIRIRSDQDRQELEQSIEEKKAQLGQLHVCTEEYLTLSAFVAGGEALLERESLSEGEFSCIVESRTGDAGEAESGEILQGHENMASVRVMCDAWNDLCRVLRLPSTPAYVLMATRGAPGRGGTYGCPEVIREVGKHERVGSDAGVIPWLAPGMPGLTKGMV